MAALNATAQGTVSVVGSSNLEAILPATLPVEATQVVGSWGTNAEAQGSTVDVLGSSALSFGNISAKGQGYVDILSGILEPEVGSTNNTASGNVIITGSTPDPTIVETLSATGTVNITSDTLDSVLGANTEASGNVIISGNAGDNTASGNVTIVGSANGTTALPDATASGNVIIEGSAFFVGGDAPSATGLVKVTGSRPATGSTSGATASGTVVITGEAEPLSSYRSLTRSLTSNYTVLDKLFKHYEDGNENYITLFRDCPRLLNLLEVFITGVDQISTDIRDLQKQAWNLEEAEGHWLDLIGLVLGLRRVTGWSDGFYRKRLAAQIQVNTCDGTMLKMLIALMGTYDYSFDDISARERIQIFRRSRNTVEVFVNNMSDLNSNGGREFIEKLVPAGARTIVAVASEDTALGDHFALDGSILEEFKRLDFLFTGSYSVPYNLADLREICQGRKLSSEYQESLVIDNTLNSDLQNLNDNFGKSFSVQDGSGVQVRGSFRVLEDRTYRFNMTNFGSCNVLIDGRSRYSNEGTGTNKSGFFDIYLTTGMHTIEVLLLTAPSHTRGFTILLEGAAILPYVESPSFGSGGGKGLGEGKLVAYIETDRNKDIDNPLLISQDAPSPNTLGFGRLTAYNERHYNTVIRPYTQEMIETTSRVPVPTFNEGV